MQETLIKRTIWVAKCNCSLEDKFQKVFTEDPPKFTMCTLCGNWIEPKEETYIGKDKFNH